MSNLSRRDFLRAFGAATAMTSLAACGKSSGGASGAAAASGSIAVCLASEPDHIDPAFNSSVDGATMLVHLFSGLAKWEQDGEGFKIAPDLAEELVQGVENADGTVTYTYKIRDAKWSDGKPVTAQDIEFSWKRAGTFGSGGDYYYMFEAVKGYDAEDKNAQLAIKAIDDKTLEVTLANAISYWDELLAFPVFFPVREDVVKDEGWCTDPSTYVCNGAYTMTGWDHNSVITIEKNPDFYDADKITMDKIEFYLSDDANNMLSNFENGTWQLIDSVPTNEMAALKEKYPEEYQVKGQIGTYYVCWNVNEAVLPASAGLSGKEAAEAEAEIRKAVGLLYDRNYIVEEIAQGGQVPASSFVAMGMKNPDGSDFTSTAGDQPGGGYYSVKPEDTQSNYDKAVEILKKYYKFEGDKFTDFPSLTYLYNTDEGHKAIGEYLQSAMSQVGITMNLENQEWNTFLNTRKAGDFSIARNGWVADYTDPICFLDMWTSVSGNNDCQLGKGAHKDVAAYSIDLTDIDGYTEKVEDGTWAKTYDVLISAIKKEADNEKRYKLMHKAEDLLMSTGVICPLYFYTDIYMINKAVKGFFSIPLGYKYFMYTTMEG